MGCGVGEEEHVGGRVCIVWVCGEDGEKCVTQLSWWCEYVLRGRLSEVSVPLLVCTLWVEMA